MLAGNFFIFFLKRVMLLVLTKGNENGMDNGMESFPIQKSCVLPVPDEREICFEVVNLIGYPVTN